MAMMVKVAGGGELKTGCVTVPGMVAQTYKKSAGGELREYRDESGELFAVYLYDGHTKASFEGLLRSSDAETLKTLGSTLTIGTGGDALKIYITEFEIQYVNNDVAKVVGAGRTYQGVCID